MSAEKPFIFIHMMTALDGKIEGPMLEADNAKIGSQDYEWTSESYKYDAWLCGRRTFDIGFTNFEAPKVIESEDKCPEGNFIANNNAELYAVAIDPSGKLAWKENTVKYLNRPASHIISVLTGKATPQYKNFLRRLGISYIIAGEKEIDFNLLVKELKNSFNIKVLSVQGGGIINWSFIKAGLVDELSILHVGVADGSSDTATLFEKSPYSDSTKPVEFELKSYEKINDNELWLKYTPKKAKSTEPARPYLGPFETGAKNDAYAQFFTGQSYLQALSTEGAAVFNVTFEPGCRNNWHIHHNQIQILLCTSGYGWYQEEGKPAQALKPGDVVNIPPNVKHWHGARKESWFSHISIQPFAENSSCEWLEPVTDEHYSKL